MFGSVFGRSASIGVGLDRRRRERFRSAAQRAVQRIAVERTFPPRNDDGRDGIADEIGQRAAFAHEPVDTQDQREARDRHRRHDRQRCREGDEARAGHARRALRTDHRDEQQGELIAQAEVDTDRLRDEQRRERHIDVGAVEVEAVTRGHDHADDRPGAARTLHLLHQARQRGFRRRGAEDEQQFGLQIGDQVEDRETARPRDRAKDDDHEEDRGQIEGGDQQAQIGERFDAIFADGESHRPERADRRKAHQHADEVEEDGRHLLHHPQYLLSRLAGVRQRETEDDGDEQRLQDRARGQRRDEGCRDDVEQEGGQRRVVRRLLVLRDRARIERRRVDVHPRARLHHIGDDQPDDQRQRREEEEIAEGLARDAAERLRLAHRGDADRHGQEDHRRDNHLDELDESVAERAQRSAGFGIEMTEQYAGHDRRQHLHVKLCIPAPRPRRFRRLRQIDRYGHRPLPVPCPPCGQRRRWGDLLREPTETEGTTQTIMNFL